MGKTLLIIVSICGLCACDKKLHEKIITGKNIKVSWYTISSITTVHEYADVSQEGETQNIIRANSESIETIQIINDTIFIKKKLPNLFYTSKDSVFNYKIKYIP